MKHDDTLSDPLFDSFGQPSESVLIDDDASVAIERANSSSSLSVLAPTQRYESKAPVAEETEQVTAPMVDNFLPAPSRWLAFGGLGIVGVLGVGSIVLTSLPHRTVVNARAMVQPTVEPQLVQAKTGGTVKSVFVKNYESLQPDQMIASFDNVPLYTELNNIQAKVNQTKQQLNHLNEEITALQQRQASGEWLGLKPTQSQFEYSRKLLLEHENELNAELAQQQQQQARVQQQIDSMIVRTPVAGTLYELEVKNVGQSIEANQTIAKIIPDDTMLEITALVSDADVSNVRVGLPVRLNLASCTSANFGILNGQVKSVERATPDVAGSFITTDSFSANANEHIVTVEAKTGTDNGGPATCKLLPGMEGDISIIAKQERFLSFFLRKLGVSSDV